MRATKAKNLTKPLRRELRASVGPLEMAIGLDAKYAEIVRNSAPFRYLIRPALRRLRASRNGRSVVTATPYRAGLSAEKPVLPVEDAATPEARAIIEKVRGYEWYHTIDLGHGVVTPGYVDHRNQAHYYGLPEDMSGMRVLDVATFDGFWAFEFERRGAEVVAIDLASLPDTDIPRNWRDEFEKQLPKEPKGRGFEIAKEILGSNVQKEICSVYDVSPERLGMFDMVFCSDLLIHLRAPLAAMEAIWTVTKKIAIFADVYNPALDGFEPHALCTFLMTGKSDIWWLPSVQCYKVWLLVARFSRVEEECRFVLNAKFEREIPKVVLRAYR